MFPAISPLTSPGYLCNCYVHFTRLALIDQTSSIRAKPKFSRASKILRFYYTAKISPQ